MRKKLRAWIYSDQEPNKSPSLGRLLLVYKVQSNQFPPQQLDLLQHYFLDRHIHLCQVYILTQDNALMHW